MEIPKYIWPEQDGKALKVDGKIIKFPLPFPNDPLPSDRCIRFVFSDPNYDPRSESWQGEGYTWTKVNSPWYNVWDWSVVAGGSFRFYNKFNDSDNLVYIIDSDVSGGFASYVYYTFTDCTSLQDHTLNGTQSIGQPAGMYQGCAGLTKIPNFPDGFKLTQPVYGSTHTSGSQIGYMILGVSNSIFKNCANTESGFEDFLKLLHTSGVPDDHHEMVESCYDLFVGCGVNSPSAQAELRRISTCYTGLRYEVNIQGKTYQASKIGNYLFVPSFQGETSAGSSKWYNDDGPYEIGSRFGGKYYNNTAVQWLIDNPIDGWSIPTLAQLQEMTGGGAYGSLYNPEGFASDEIDWNDGGSPVTPRSPLNYFRTNILPVGRYYPYPIGSGSGWKDTGFYYPFPILDGTTIKMLYFHCDRLGEGSDHGDIRFGLEVYSSGDWLPVCLIKPFS
jgi:hypothetical protein